MSNAREVKCGPHRLRWTERGAGPKVVLVHSGGMSSRQWKRVVELLEADHACLLPDLLGYGQSSAWPSAERFHFVHDLLALEAMLDALGEPVHLVGHSYGGFLALLVALHRPRLTRSIAVYEPVSFGVLRSMHDHGALSTLMNDDVDAPLPATAAELDAWLERFIAYWNGPGAWQTLSGAMQDTFRSAGHKLIGEVRSLGVDRTPHDAYRHLTMPALLLGGARSTLAADRVLRVLLQEIPDARRVVLPEAGHMGPLTHAADVATDLLRHFAAAPRPQG